MSLVHALFCVAGAILCDGLTWAEVSSFLGAQVNTARFAWHLQYAGTFMIGYFQVHALFCVAGAILCDGLTWAEGTESV